MLELSIKVNIKSELHDLCSVKITAVMTFHINLQCKCIFTFIVSIVILTDNFQKSVNIIIL